MSNAGEIAPRKTSSEPAEYPCFRCGVPTISTVGQADGPLLYARKCHPCQIHSPWFRSQSDADAWWTPCAFAALLAAVREYLGAEASETEDRAREVLRQIANG